jgi:predicted nucleic acid-binding protein
VIVHLDTSALVDALTGPRRALAQLTAIVERGDRIGCSSFVLYEWMRGPRVRAELQAQESLLPREQAVPFSGAEAALAAGLYAKVVRARHREIDLAIAACALAHNAALWTLNREDFRDIPDLRLI